MQLDIKCALLCDLVRVENTGKHILVGVYGGDVVFGRMPSTFSPTFWIQIVPPTRPNIEIEAKLDVPGIKKPHTIDISAKMGEQEESVILIMPVPPLQMTEAGRLRLSMRPKSGGPWTEVLSKKIQSRESSPPAS